MKRFHKYKKSQNIQNVYKEHLLVKKHQFFNQFRSDNLDF